MHYTNYEYAEKGGVSNNECNELEILFLKLIDWNVFVSPKIYYNCLRSLLYKSALIHNTSKLLQF